MPKRAIYSNPAVADTEQFFDSLQEQASAGSESAFDSVRAKDAAAGISLSDETKVPAGLLRVLDSVGEEHKDRVLCAVMAGMDSYRREHGCLPTADILDSALHQGYAASRGLRDLGIFDSAGSTNHSDPLSAAPARTIVAVMSAIAEAIPFATYLPADITSNEARLAIISHKAGSSTGDYAADDMLDGVESGDEFLSSERRVTLTKAIDLLTATGKINAHNGTTANVSVLRGRTLIFVNGLPSAQETTNSAAAANPVSGVATIAGVDYTISGTVTIATGAIALAFAPALPAGTVVEAEGFVDFEVAPTLAPKVVTHFQNFALYAVPWRATADASIDARTQGQNELSMDLQSESIIAVRSQYANERHYMGLKKLLAVAANNGNVETYDFDSSVQLAQKTRSQVWQDFGAVFGIANQQMAEDTMDHGITHMYVTKNIMAQLNGLPADMFVKSGVTARPGIYRIGTLWGGIEVYYTPKVLTESSTAGQILCIGRSTQVARCPLVLGDAVPATYIPLAVTGDLKYGNGFYARGFTQVNPHAPSAKGAALINVTNLF